MAICKLMISDFMIKTGRYPDCFNNKEAYSDRDLIEGVEYCEWLLSDNYKYEPFYKFNLRDFIKWAKLKLPSVVERRISCV